MEVSSAKLWRNWHTWEKVGVTNPVTYESKCEKKIY